MPATSNKYQILHDKRRRQIIDTAKKMILEKNIAAVTMSDIAAACDISRQTLYKYFSSFDAVIYGIQGEIIENLILPRGKTITEYVCSTADMLFDYYQTHHDDFMFICIFDVYIRTHKTEDEMNRHYREVIWHQLPNLTMLKNDTAFAGDPASMKEIFTVSIHIIWGFITRMAVLGDHFCETGNISEEKGVQIVKDILIVYLKNSGIV